MAQCNNSVETVSELKWNVFDNDHINAVLRIVANKEDKPKILSFQSRARKCIKKAGPQSGIDTDLNENHPLSLEFNNFLKGIKMDDDEKRDLDPVFLEKMYKNMPALIDDNDVISDENKDIDIPALIDEDDIIEDEHLMDQVITNQTDKLRQQNIKFEQRLKYLENQNKMLAAQNRIFLDRIQEMEQKLVMNVIDRLNEFDMREELTQKSITLLTTLLTDFVLPPSSHNNNNNNNDNNTLNWNHQQPQRHELKFLNNNNNNNNNHNNTLNWNHQQSQRQHQPPQQPQRQHQPPHFESPPPHTINSKNKVSLRNDNDNNNDNDFKQKKKKKIDKKESYTKTKNDLLTSEVVDYTMIKTWYELKAVKLILKTKQIQKKTIFQESWNRWNRWNTSLNYKIMTRPIATLIENDIEIEQESMKMNWEIYLKETLNKSINAISQKKEQKASKYEWTENNLGCLLSNELWLKYEKLKQDLNQKYLH